MTSTSRYQGIKDGFNPNAFNRLDEFRLLYQQGVAAIDSGAVKGETTAGKWLAFLKSRGVEFDKDEAKRFRDFLPKQDLTQTYKYLSKYK